MVPNNITFRNSCLNHCYRLYMTFRVINEYTGFKLGLDSRKKWLLPQGKLGRSDSKKGRILTQNYGIFCLFRSKLAISHTVAIKWKEKYDAVVVDCHHTTQSVMYLTADTSLTEDSGVASSISARFHTFVEIDHEIISTVILLPSADSRRVVNYKQK